MRRIVSAVVASLALAASAPGDIVYMKDGTIHRGEVTRDGNRLLIKKSIATIALNPEDVRQIIKSEPRSRPAKTPAVTTAAPAKADAEAHTRPESYVFLAMRQLAGTPGAVDAHSLRQKITQWRLRVHNRERLAFGRWLSPADTDRQYDQFATAMKKGDEILRQLRRIRGTTARDRARQARYRRSLGVRLREASRHWPDPLLRDFLMGASNLEGLSHINALALFRKCREVAPRVAAFWQGEGLALAGRGQKVAALAAYLQVLNLKPNSRDAFDLVVQGMKETPGDEMDASAFVMAREIVSLYEESSGRKRTQRGTTWMMPGRPCVAREYGIPTLPYDRLVFRQGVGTPVAKNVLLVDREVIKDALEVFVAVGQIVVPGQTRRVSASSSKKGLPPLALVSVGDLEFTPLTTDSEAKLPAGEPVTAYALNLHEEMGSDVRTMPTKIESHGPDGQARLADGLMPGEVAAPVIAGGNRLAGFLLGKTDAMVDGGGPGGFIGAGEIAELVKRASRTSTYYGGYRRAKRKIVPKPAPGVFFVVHVTAAEAPETKRR